MKTKLIKTQKELELMRKSGKILAEIFLEIKKIIKPGISGIEIERLVDAKAAHLRASCSFKGYKNYQYCACISANNIVVHDIPNKKKFRSGDVVSIDIGINYQGYHTDKAVTFPVGGISSERKHLIATTKEALGKAIKIIKPGIDTSQIGEIIQKTIENKNYHVVRDLAGHGIGKKIHEPPTIYNFKTKQNNTCLQKGMCIAIEPMLGKGTGQIKLLPNGWGISTADNSDSCHFEDTIEVTAKGARILTR